MGAVQGLSGLREPDQESSQGTEGAGGEGGAVKKPRVFYAVKKVLPWSSLTASGWQFPFQISVAGGGWGYIPVFDSEEAARKEFPDDEFFALSTPESVVEPKKRKARKKPRE